MTDERTPDDAVNSAVYFPPAEERRSQMDRRRIPDRRQGKDSEHNLKTGGTSNKEIDALFAELEMRVSAAIRQNEWRAKNDGSGWDKLIVPLPKDFPTQGLRSSTNRKNDASIRRVAKRVELEYL
ncbi:MAG: hypothetical protein JNL84_01195 [Candidatus Accumulibacter sp.]|nr:hypothetical protein [Accumulibacter sp.]